ncbi:major histocompatibility complex class I-related gene protein-like [Archocentrus centrarchus]|uniref:major histocompatibility complex class I-related gene protein-like n=1 Tax=Archocentrus centrarchus TaxID=63155 RepID=UPI0011EA0077|nr:major histocompatibility complex class I-related gene protein-like [Archocentrus centrarchus]
MFICFIYLFTNILNIVCPTVKHSLVHFLTGSSGIPHLSEFVGFAEVDGIQMIYCDGDNKIFEPRQDWMKNILDNNPQLLEMYNQQCFVMLPNHLREELISMKQQSNQSGAVSILQLTAGCEWDEETGEVTGSVHYAYNGEAFLEFLLETLTWSALKPEADVMKQRYNADIIIKQTEAFLTPLCTDLLKMFLNNSKRFLQRTVLPSVSLLQKSPSSPISCHATGFYPDRAMMFWRKDGEEVHEGVDHGEILPNNDGTFQMSVDLNISSITPKDWSRYECVFQLSGAEDGIVTNLNNSVFRTNWGKN